VFRNRLRWPPFSASGHITKGYGLTVLTISNVIAVK
jgi:hypothetical protein